MIQIRTFKILNKLGIHARVAAKIVDTARRFQAEIFLEKDGQAVNGRSILSILTLFCPQGSELTIRAEGIDADAAMDALAKMVEGKFGEA
jgi:phosphocarrier protein